VRKENDVIERDGAKSGSAEKPFCFPGPEQDGIVVESAILDDAACEWIEWIVFEHDDSSGRCQFGAQTTH